MIVDKELLVKLRKQTLAGFSDCKKALENTSNNFDEAIVWLRKNGIAKANSKFGDKIASEGKVFVGKDDLGAVILEINSETDFTANSEPFETLASEITKKILYAKSNDLSKILDLVIDAEGTIKDKLLSLSSITGEKIQLKRVEYVANDNKTIAVYQHHTKKIATLVKANKKTDEEIVKSLSIHLAANNPKFLSPDKVDQEWLKKEKDIAADILKQDPSKAAFFDKIIDKKMEKIIDENCFTKQCYLFDAKKTVENVLKDLDISIEKAIYFEIIK